MLKSIDQTNNADQESRGSNKNRGSRNSSKNANKNLLRKMTKRDEDIDKGDKLEFESLRPVLIRKITEVYKPVHDFKRSGCQFISERKGKYQ